MDLPIMYTHDFGRTGDLNLASTAALSRGILTGTSRVVKQKRIYIKVMVVVVSPKASEFPTCPGDGCHKILSAMLGGTPSRVPASKSSNQLKLAGEECFNSRPQHAAISKMLAGIAY